MEFVLYKSCSIRVIVIDELEQPVVRDDNERCSIASQLLDRENGIGADILAFLLPARKRSKADASVRFFSIEGLELSIDEMGILATADYLLWLRRKSGEAALSSVQLLCELNTKQPRIYRVMRGAPLTAELVEHYKVNLGVLRKYEHIQFDGNGVEINEMNESLLSIRLYPNLLQEGKETISGRLDGYLTSLGEPYLVIFCGDSNPGIRSNENRDMYLNDLLEGCLLYPDILRIGGEEASSELFVELGRNFSILPMPKGGVNLIVARAEEPNKIIYRVYDRAGDSFAITNGASATVTSAIGVVLGICQSPVMAIPVLSTRTSRSLSGYRSSGIVSQDGHEWAFEGIVKRISSGRC